MDEGQEEEKENADKGEGAAVQTLLENACCERLASWATLASFIGSFCI